MVTANYSNVGPASNPDEWKTLSGTYGDGDTLRLGPINCLQYDSIIVGFNVSLNGGSSNDFKILAASTINEKDEETFTTYPDPIKTNNDTDGDLDQAIVNDGDMFISAGGDYTIYKLNNMGGLQALLQLVNNGGVDRGTLTVRYRRANFLWYG